MIGVVVASLAVAVLYVAVKLAAERGQPLEPPTTIPGTALTCSTRHCHQVAVTVTAGRLACDNCAQYLATLP